MLSSIYFKASCYCLAKFPKKVSKVLSLIDVVLLFFVVVVVLKSENINLLQADLCKSFFNGNFGPYIALTCRDKGLCFFLISLLDV